MNARDMAIRFAFGAAVSTVAGLIGMAFGAKVGGLFLAFPAIMPAGLTLIEDKEDRHEADRNATGAVIGAVALLGFAVAQVAAMGVWLLIALGLYAIARAVFDFDG